MLSCFVTALLYRIKIKEYNPAPATATKPLLSFAVQQGFGGRLSSLSVTDLLHKGSFIVEMVRIGETDSSMHPRLRAVSNTPLLPEKS